MTAWKPKPLPIDGELRTRINQIAHAAGQRRAIDIKAELTQALRVRASAGDRLEALNKALDDLESTLKDKP